MRSNCLFWGVCKKIQVGGTLKFKSLENYYYVPRTYWSPNMLDWYRFTPYNPVRKPTLFQKLFPFHVLLFKGYVKKVNLWN